MTLGCLEERAARARPRRREMRGNSWLQRIVRDGTLSAGLVLAAVAWWGAAPAAASAQAAPAAASAATSATTATTETTATGASAQDAAASTPGRPGPVAIEAEHAARPKAVPAPPRAGGAHQ